MNEIECMPAPNTQARCSLEDALSALDAAHHRIASLEEIVVCLLIKNEHLRQQNSGIHTPHCAWLSIESNPPLLELDLHRH